MLGFEPGPIEPSLPIVLFCATFGLSIDYEVLLLTRIQEEYRSHGDNTRAVVQGLQRSGKLITGAAGIMIAVFASYLTAEVVLLRIVGVGMAIAVAMDATIVRMLLVPATMRLLGNLNWWAPKVLACRRRSRGTSCAKGLGSRSSTPHGRGVADTLAIVGFNEAFREYRALGVQRKEVCRRVLPDGAAQLNDIAVQQSAIVRHTATRLPKRGVDAEAAIRALRGDDEATRRFALAVLKHRNHFPRVYLEAAVEAAIRCRSSRFFETACRWHGAATVLDAITRAVDGGALSYRDAGFYEYYVRARPDEDPRAVTAAGALLRQSVRQLPDAPPAARSASAPLPGVIVQIVGWYGTTSTRDHFARAIDSRLGCGMRRAEALLDRTEAHPGAVALELPAEMTEALLEELATTGVALRTIPVVGKLGSARQIVTEIRAVLAACGSRADVDKVRRDLDPLRSAGDI